jgi:general secretion pathway protein E
MLEAALNLAATDIHIEPSREGVRVRLRVDGLLRPHQSLPGRMARAVVSRVKILAGLNIAERRLPQDGRAVLASARLRRICAWQRCRPCTAKPSSSASW